jgi:hypothetical protein
MKPHKMLDEEWIQFERSLTGTVSSLDDLEMLLRFDLLEGALAPASEFQEDLSVAEEDLERPATDVGG